MTANPSSGKTVYYLRYSALISALKAGLSAEVIGGLLTQVEADKATYAIDTAAEQQDLDNISMMALATFKRADAADRSGAANQSTVKSYNNVAILLNVARVMSAEKGTEPDTQLEKIAKHAKGRMLEINTALREGRQAPLPSDDIDILGGVGASKRGVRTGSRVARRRLH